MYSFDGKADFSASFIEFHMILQTLPICWFGAQETFLIIINVKKSCAAWYVYENRDTFPPKIHWGTEKNSIYLKQKYFITVYMSLLSL